ncbi:MAG: hypothetical protein RSD39_02675 [Oscillospiraceae bacterium]
MQELFERAVLSSADKFMDDIENDTLRAVRKLLEIGELMTINSYQHELIVKAKKVLERDSKGYGKLAGHICKSVDRSTLHEFFTDFAYNGLTKGARKIREIKKDRGLNIPWSITLELGKSGTGDELFDWQSKVIEEGVELGIYSYVLDATSWQCGIEAPISLVSKFEECSFFILCRPETVLAATSLDDVKNTMFMIEADKEKYEEAVKMLTSSRKLWGAFFVYDDKEAELIAAGKFSSKQKPADSDVVMLVAAKECSAESIAKVGAYVGTRREKGCPGCALLEYQRDIAGLSRKMTGVPLFFEICCGKEIFSWPKANDDISLCGSLSETLEKLRY